MKSVSVLITISLLIILIGCKNSSTKNSNKVVETYRETAECLIGEWETEDKSEKNMHFKFSASINGDEVNNRNFTVEAYDKNGSVLHQALGSWKIEKVGQVRAEINGGAIGFSIKLTNCNRFVVRGRTVYIKL